MLSRILAFCVSPGGSRAALSILIFHRVLPQADPLFPRAVDAARFDTVLRWLKASFTVVRLDHAVEMLRSGTLPPRAVAITFDDGYADNYTVALPILQRHGMSATFFIASGFLDGGRMFNDTAIEMVRRFEGDELDFTRCGLGRYGTRNLVEKRNAIACLIPKLKYLTLEERAHKLAEVSGISGVLLPDDLMMSSTQVRSLHAGGMAIGGHTRTHPILSTLDDEKAFDEISGDKVCLEAIVGEPITLFAYPNGKPGRDYLVRHTQMVRQAGYLAAVSTSPGAARRGADLYQLPRFTPWDRTPLRFGLRLVHNLRSAGEVAA